MSVSDPFTLPDLCRQRVTALLGSGNRRILGIAGAPGAGKSSLAQAIARQFGESVQVVPMDGFHLANSELLRLGRRGRKGAPDTFDAAGYLNLMHRLKHQAADEVVYAPDYSRDAGEAIAGAIAVGPTTPLIVTEGNYLLQQDAPWNKLRGMLDEIWFLNVSDDLRRERLLARHMRFGRTEQQARDWVTHTDEPNALRIGQGRTRADVQVTW